MEKLTKSADALNQNLWMSKGPYSFGQESGGDEEGPGGKLSYAPFPSSNLGVCPTGLESSEGFLDTYGKITSPSEPSKVDTVSTFQKKLMLRRMKWLVLRPVTCTAEIWAQVRLWPSFRDPCRCPWRVAWAQAKTLPPSSGTCSPPPPPPPPVVTPAFSLDFGNTPLSFLFRLWFLPPFTLGWPRARSCAESRNISKLWMADLGNRPIVESAQKLFLCKLTLKQTVQQRPTGVLTEEDLASQ